MNNARFKYPSRVHAAMQNQLKGMSEEMKTLCAQFKEAVETIKPAPKKGDKAKSDKE
ncbi:MAG: hypothetical protein VCA34_08525 [Roseibacillus sp.]